MFVDPFNRGQLINNVYKESFSIKLYEIQADHNASVETLVKHLQEIGINHLKFVGLMGDSLGSTPKMSKSNLIWVVLKFQIQMENYPSWGDVLEVNTWIRQHGKNNMCRDWQVRNHKTGKTMMQATSVWAMMHKTTRKLSRFTDEMKQEIYPHCNVNSSVLIPEGKKINNLTVVTADFIKYGISPHWVDLDVYEHVKNGKYLGWILQSIPISMFETHEITDIVLEYRKECIMGNVLQSLCALTSAIENSSLESKIEYDHVLQLESGHILLKGRTTWRQKV